MKSKNEIARFFWLDGRKGRGEFFAAGLLLAVSKYLIDSVVASIFNRPWSVTYYWAGSQIELLTDANRAKRAFLAWMLTISIPFVWAGIALTVKRLRSVGLQFWLSLLFFVPVLNLIFFLLLSILPAAEQSDQDEEEPTPEPSAVRSNSLVRRTIKVVLSAAFGAALTIFGVYGVGGYGVGLFVSLPFCIGMITVMLQSYDGKQGFKECVLIPILCMAIIAVILMVLALEGAGCLLMAAPIWLACGMLGGIVGYFILRHTRDTRAIAIAIVVLALLVPVFMGAEMVLKPDPEIAAVKTAVEIEATPGEVWERVIAFPPLSEPTEFYFRMGVAYPTDATIIGSGVGAERRCNFSTGTFVEPIEVWDEPHMLKFSVRDNPPPMREFSLYKEVHPPHLHGFLVSRSGQFRLTPLEGGKTLLEGTTWYQNDMAPFAYWRLWSDAIIHRIHLRVLRHIKLLSEAEDFAEASKPSR